MRKIVVDPENVVLVEMSDKVLVGRDPYSIATKRLHDIHSLDGLKRKFTNLESKVKLDLVSNIVENMF